MNGCLLLVLVAILVYAICVRLSPREMRRVADWLNSRADAEDYWRERFARYKEQRGVQDSL